MTQVMPWSAASDDDDEPGTLAPATGGLRGRIEQRRPLPSRAEVASHSKWYLVEGGKWLGGLLVQLPVLILTELKPISFGAVRLAVGWARWCAARDHADRLTAAEDKTQKGAERLESRREWRLRWSLALLAVVLGAGVWAWFYYPLAVYLAGGLLVVACDAAGRVGTEKVKSLPPPMRTVLREGVPLSQVTAGLLETFEREGLDVGIDRPMRYDPVRKDYRLMISCRDAILPEHLRALERGIGAADRAIRSLATDIATVRELVIRDGDPLNDVVPAPWLESGSVSISDPLEVGVSMTDTPFALHFADQHFKVIGSTGSGKSAWFLRNCIDRVSAARNAAVLGIDLHGMELDLWRGVIQRKGRTPDEAKALLTEVLAEIARRTAVLRRYAIDDDPSNDHLTEWCDELAEKEGPAWVIFVDEYHKVAEHPELLAMCETVVREGRKVWITMKALSQKYGNSDFGSKVMTTQANTTIAFPCDPEDAVRIFGKAKRDSGWDPSILTPGTKNGDRHIRNDAGKGFVESPNHTTPDIYGCFAPLSAGEVKARARRRLADGIPPMYVGGRTDDVEDVAVVPPILVAVEKAFANAGNPEWMATVDLLPLVQAMGFAELTENALSSGIPVDKNEPGSRKRRPKETNPRQGYLLVSIHRAMEQL